MEGLLKVLEERIGDIVTIVFFSAIGFIIYMLAPNNDTLRRRLRGAFLGFFVSIAASYPVFLAIGRDQWWALAAISSVLTISGQFLPELIQSTFKKYVKKLSKKIEEN